MPISNEIKVSPTDTSGGPSALVPEGVYDAEITDITYVPGEQNQFTGRPQLKLRFKILGGEYKDLELRSWVSMSLNPGWEQGNPSNLYLIAKAVLGDEPNPDEDFLPAWLMGGKLRILVEERTSKKGTKYSKVTKYLSPTARAVSPKEEEKKMEEAVDESIDSKVPF